MLEEVWAGKAMALENFKAAEAVKRARATSGQETLHLAMKRVQRRRTGVADDHGGSVGLEGEQAENVVEERGRVEEGEEVMVSDVLRSPVAASSSPGHISRASAQKNLPASGSRRHVGRVHTRTHPGWNRPLPPVDPMENLDKTSDTIMTQLVTMLEASTSKMPEQQHQQQQAQPQQQQPPQQQATSLLPLHSLHIALP